MESIHKLITLIGLDNNMGVLPIEKIPSQDEVSGYDLVKLEAQAAQLSDEDSDLLATGEMAEVNALVGTLGLEELDRFLNDAFDGHLTDLYFTPATGG